MDTEPPRPPDVVTPDRVVYHRLPWGGAATGGLRTFALEGAEGAVEPRATVIVLDGPDRAVAVELGRGRADDRGAFGGPAGSPGALELSRADRAAVYVGAADEAGNLGEVVVVRDAEWTATLAGRQPGDALDNPHRLVTAARLGPALVQAPLSTWEPAASLLGHLATPGTEPLVRRGEPRWIPRHGEGRAPTGRSGHAVAYDSARGRVVVFGVDRWQETAPTTWEWDPATLTWEDVTPAGEQPPARFDYAMAYDEARGKVVLFGGWSNLAPWQDTWEWDGAAGTWTDVTPDLGSPPARSRHAMAYDPQARRVVVFGGAGERLLQDTWEWDGGSGVWRERPKRGYWPRARRDAAMASDRRRGRLLLVGGRDGRGWLGDTWEWDGARGTWTEVGVANGSGVSGCQSPRAAYDRRRSRALLLASCDGEDLHGWEWDGGGWTEAPWTGAGPGRRHDFAVVFADLAGGVLLSGGCFEGVAAERADAWLWDPSGGTWREVTPAPARPAARTEHAMALDTARGRVVLFGGVDGEGRYLGDTWEWSAATGRWAEVAGEGGGPGPRAHHAMAFDAARGRVVLFGGQRSEELLRGTWEYDGEAGRWTDVSPGDGGPSERGAHAMVFDEERRRVLLFGGSRFDEWLDDTWEWDGAAGTWAEVSPAGARPAPREGHALAYDPVRETVVLFGGSGAEIEFFDGLLWDTWEWDGAGRTWTEVTPEGPGPLPRTGHGLAYEPVRGKVVLFGGLGFASLRQGEGLSVSTLADTWEWDGASRTWSEARVSGERPAASAGHALVASGTPWRLFVFGGSPQTWSGDSDAAWEWDGGGGDRPAAIWEVSWRDARSPGAAFRRLALTAVAGGRGHPAGAAAQPSPGVELLGWSTRFGGWTSLGSIDADAGAPGTLRSEITDESALRSLVLGAGARMTFAVAPREPSGGAPERSVVALDYLELSLRYRSAVP